MGTVYAEIPTVHAAVATVHAAMAEARRSAAEASTGIAIAPAVAGTSSAPAGEAPAAVGVTSADSAEAALPAATVRPVSEAASDFTATVHDSVGEPAIPVGAVRVLVPPAVADAVGQRRPLTLRCVLARLVYPHSPCIVEAPEGGVSA